MLTTHDFDHIRDIIQMETRSAIREEVPAMIDAAIEKKVPPIVERIIELKLKPIREDIELIKRDVKKLYRAIKTLRNDLLISFKYLEDKDFEIDSRVSRVEKILHIHT
ncbi:MAG: hypothetical protein ABIO02_00795 [Patescibacteria group bacterium]